MARMRKKAKQRSWVAYEMIVSGPRAVKIPNKKRKSSKLPRQEMEMGGLKWQS